MEGSAGADPIDRELVRDFLDQRSELAFDRLYRRHAPRLFPLLRRLAGGPPGEIEELFQESWLRIVEGLPRFLWRSSFRTWSAGIAVNCVREWRRRRTRAHAGEPHDPEDPSASAGRLADALDLEEAISRLPDGYREVLLLHDVHGHTHEEIGELLSISPGTSKSQLFHARRAARRSLTGDEPDE